MPDRVDFQRHPSRVTVGTFVSSGRPSAASGWAIMTSHVRIDLACPPFIGLLRQRRLTTGSYVDRLISPSRNVSGEAFGGGIHH
jgi:hypothetical protein